MLNLRLPILLSLLFLVGFNSHARATTIGSGQLFTSLVESSAGILGVDQDGIWLSTDDGATFNNVYGEPEAQNVYFALAATGNTVVAVGEFTAVLRSTDGGNNWTEVTSPALFGDLLSVATDGNGVWLATGDALSAQLIRSIDNGQTWTELTVPTASSLRAIAWQADSEWILAGDGDLFGGIIYRSTDDGDSWTMIANALAEPINAIAINDVGLITVAGQSGLILQGTGSSTFTAPTGYSPISQDLYVVIATGSGDFLVGGEAGSLLSVDGSGVVDNSLGGQPDITAMRLLVNDDLLISGEYEAPVPQERTIPFELLLSRDAVSRDYVLTVEETLSDRDYRIESSVDLQNWSEVIGSERAGNDAGQVWTYSEEGSRLFWRAVEF